MVLAITLFRPLAFLSGNVFAAELPVRRLTDRLTELFGVARELVPRGGTFAWKLTFSDAREDAEEASVRSRAVLLKKNFRGS